MMNRKHDARMPACLLCFVTLRGILPRKVNPCSGGALAAGAMAILAMAGPGGCGGSSPDQAPVAAAPPPRPSAPPKPAAPEVTPVSQLMSEFGIDERVMLPEEKAPATTPARRAILEFFDAFARGDEAAVGTMISSVDRTELDSLVGSGSWSRTTSGISQIDVQSGQSPEGQSCALAIFYVNGDFQPQMW